MKLNNTLLTAAALHSSTCVRVAVQATVACLALLALGACSKAKTDSPPVSAIQPTMPNATVPPADTVFAAPSLASNASAAAGRSNSNLTRADEANAMPLPGQNNDHSAPVLPASAPK